MSPQLEQGYTRIADTILEKVATTKLNGTQFRILMIVWRSTYGWQKKEHELSLGYLAKATNIHKQQIKKELDKMIKLEIISVVKPHTDTTPRILGFNKKYVKEVQSVEKVTVSEKEYPTVSELTDPTVSELEYQNKELNKQYNKDHQEALKMNISFDVETVWKAYPNKKGKKNSFNKIPKILKTITKEKLIKAIKAYDKTITDRTYMMHGSTFFNGGYEDYIIAEGETEEPKRNYKTDDVPQWVKDKMESEQ